jgi:hypothetical protein
MGDGAGPGGTTTLMVLVRNIGHLHGTGDACEAIDSHCSFWATIYLTCPSDKEDTPQEARRGKLRSWRLAILRARAHYLSDPDERAAETAAVSEFNPSDKQRKRVERE